MSTAMAHSSYENTGRGKSCYHCPRGPWEGPLTPPRRTPLGRAELRPRDCPWGPPEGPLTPPATDHGATVTATWAQPVPPRCSRTTIHTDTCPPLAAGGAAGAV